MRISFGHGFSRGGKGRRWSTGARSNGRCGRVWYQYATDETSSDRLFAWPCSMVTRIEEAKVTGSSTWKR